MANFLFVLSQDDNEAATRCFQLAQIAHSKGHKTDLFFINNGVNWANSERDFNVKTATGDCFPCANARQVDETKFFSNMMLDGGPHLIELAAEAKVFNF